MDYMAREVGINLSLIQSAISGNVLRKKLMARRILRKAEAFTSPKIAVLGIAFKGGTDDCRESPAVDIVKELLLLGAKKIEIFDPQALNNAKRIFAESVTYAKDVESCVKDADVLVVLTEWEEFKNINLESLA